MKIASIVFSIGVCFSFVPVLAEETFPACQSGISELKSEGFVVPLNEVPTSVLVARTAKVYVDTPTLHFQANQDFIKAKSQVTCLSEPSGDSRQSYKNSLSAPTLLDFTGDKSVGNSVWQFSILVSRQQIGVWNQVSHRQSQEFQISDLIPSHSSSSGERKEVYFSQVGHDQYELMIKWLGKNESRAVVVLFDATQP